MLCPSYFSYLSSRCGGQCHNPSDNQSILLLSSSFFVSLPGEASYLCITGPQYPFTSFCIRPALSKQYSKIFGTLVHDEKKEQIKVANRKNSFKWSKVEKLHYLDVRFLRDLSTSVTFLIVGSLVWAYICIKCHKKLLNGLVPQQVVTKKLGIVFFLKEFELVNKLEKNTCFRKNPI